MMQAYRRLGAALASALFLPSALGCYSKHLVTDGRVAPDAEVEVTVNDKGRVALAERLGPGVLRISGRLAQRSDSALVIRASSVEYLGVGSSVWSGEPVTVSTDFVGLMVERRLSKPRSWSVAGAAVIAVVAAAIALDLGGGAGGGGPSDGGGNPALGPR